MADSWKLLRDAGLSERAIVAIKSTIQKQCKEDISEVVFSMRSELTNSLKSDVRAELTKTCRDLIDVHETHCLSKQCSVPKADNTPKKLCCICGKTRVARDGGCLCVSCLKKEFDTLAGV